MFLQISILEWFLKDHVTLKTGVMILLILLICITEINDILKYMQIENSYLNCNNFSQYYRFDCIFDHINAALVSIRGFFQKH